MRHRLVCPLYDKHPKHLEVLNHLLEFSRADRGRELATLVVAGYQALYGRDGDAVPQSLNADLGDLINHLARLQSNSNSGTPELSKPSPASAPLESESKNSSNDGHDGGRLEDTTNKNKEPSEPKEPRVLTPPKTPMKPSEELLDEPLTTGSSADEIEDPLTSLGRMFS